MIAVHPGGRVDDREPPPRHHAGAAGAHVQRHPLGLERLQAHGGEALADRGVDVGARVVVALQVGVAIGRRGGGQVDLRLLEIVVAQHDLAGGGAVALGDEADGVGALLQPGPLAVGDGLVAVDGIGGGAVVLEDDQLARVVAVGEPVDALLLQQPAGEGERALPVLDAVLPLGVAAHEPPRLVALGHAQLGEDERDDLLDVLVLEDAAVDLLPEEAHQRGDVEAVHAAAVLVGVVGRGDERDAHDHAVEVVLGVAAPAPEGEPGHLAEQVVGLHRAGREHVDLGLGHATQPPRQPEAEDVLRGDGPGLEARREDLFGVRVRHCPPP
jgi:hypothetical protein